MDSLTLKTFLVEFFLSVSLLATLIYNSAIVRSVQFPLFDREVYSQTLFLLVLGGFIVFNTDFGTFTPGLLFGTDGLALSSKLILCITLFAALVLGQSHFYRAKINLFEFYSITLLALISLMILVSSYDLISIYISLEMQSLCFYILAAINRYSAFSTEAGLKYFVLGAFISGLFLFGASILYGITGTTNLNSYALLFSSDLTTISDISGNSDLNLSIFFLGILFILVAILFKLAAAPFHIWSPDVYEGAPLNSTIIFVLVPKLVILVVLFRVLYYSFFTYFGDFQTLLIISGTLSVLIGSFMALRQKRVKRLLIFSSISHVGFILLGCATGTILGLTSVIYYLIFYIITSILVWGAITLLTNHSGSSLYLTDLAVLARTNPILGFTFALGFFSLAGIPPLVGFSMKFFIFSAAINADLYMASVIIILLSVLGAFYYLRVIKVAYFEKLNTSKNILVINDEFTVFLISLSFLLITVTFFNPNLFLLQSYKMALSLGLM